MHKYHKKEEEGKNEKKENLEIKENKIDKTKVLPFKVDVNKLINYQFPPAIILKGQFKKEYHDQSVNYFQVYYDNDFVRTSQDKKFDNFMNQYFLIEPDKEELTWNFAEIGGVEVKNFFVAKYLNRMTQKAKDYFVLVDYGKNEADLSPYSDKKIIGMDEDDFYMGNYQYTIQKDCDTAQVQLGDNFKTFVCTREVNFGNFYVRGVYKINAVTYEDKTIDTVVACISKTAEKANDTNSPNNISGLTAENITDPQKIVTSFM